MNGAIFDPEKKTLIISANAKNVNVFPEYQGEVTIAITELNDGIEIIHEDDRIWWPV